MNDHLHPLVTIGLPTYNRAQGLKKTIECIQAQTYRNLEIIISDNHSTDGEVQQAIQAFAASDSRVQSFLQPENIGLENNFNFVFEKSTAGYFMWMSDDDYFEANYIEACVNFLKANPSYVLCSGIARYYSNDKFVFTEKMFRTENEKPMQRVFRLFNNIGKNGNFYGVFKNRLLLQKPIGEHIGCDWTFMARLALVGKLNYTDSTSYQRSADGNSGTKQKMIKKFGFNKLQAVFFETTSAYYITSNIFKDKTVNAKFSYLQRAVINTFVFFQINYRAVLQFAYKVRGKNFFNA